MKNILSMNNLPEEKVKEFVEKYKKTVSIPNPKGKQFLLCPIGLVGSGKTTILKSLSEKLGLVRVSSDEIRKMLKENGFNYDRRGDIAFSVIEFFINKGYGISIDSDCARPDKIEQIKKESVKFKIPLIWIHINPPEEFILNKLKNYPHSWLFKDAEEAIKNYKSRKPLHKNLSFDFTYTFDTSRPDLNNQIDEAVAIIQKKLKL